MTVDRKYRGTLDMQPSERELAHRRLAADLAVEGMVLLKNEGMLPLSTSVPVALLGGGAVRTIKGGTGSGDVNNRESSSVYEGVKKLGVSITSGKWLEDYQKCYEDARNAWREKVLEEVKKGKEKNGFVDIFYAYAENPFLRPEGRVVCEEDIQGAQAAVYVISRISGEGKDRRKEEGDYYLSEKEKEDILFLNQAKLPIVLVLNTGGPVEIAGVLQKAKNIKAILYISLPGQEGGDATARVLFGRAVPGGRLAATWAVHYEDYPSAMEYGYLNGNLESEEYTEGIYVGYRYFDSFGIQPLFPFGYGMSYTSFLIEFQGIQAKVRGISVRVTVRNTGKHFPGREVVQVYLTPPQKGHAREYQSLAGFAKTDVLQPGESQELTIDIEQKQLAVFSEQRSAWIVEAGKYGVWVGNNSASLQLTALISVEKNVLLEAVEGICPEGAGRGEYGSAKFAESRECEWISQAKKQGAFVLEFLPQAEERKILPTAFPGWESVDKLISFLYGNISEKADSMLGAAGIRVPGSAGEMVERAEDGTSLFLIMADGPAGLRLQQKYEVDRETGQVYGTGVLGSLENGFLQEMEQHPEADTYYQYCTAFPVGTVLAQTWDTELLKGFGTAVEAEMEEFCVGLWLAPGMNIQRNPLCGRNFEYYSEDPLLSGMMAAAVTKGVQESGKCGVTLKHFACNNQEDNRIGVDVRVSEKALREIYLRGFEIAIKESEPAAIMTSYNRINGVHAANSSELCTTVARKEWGFSGMIMTDWNTTAFDGASIPWKCIAAGNDLIMPGNKKDDEDIRRAYAEGKLSKDAIRECAARTLWAIHKYGSLRLD